VTHGLLLGLMEAHSDASKAEHSLAQNCCWHYLV